MAHLSHAKSLPLFFKAQAFVFLTQGRDSYRMSGLTL